jgi:hypothetical protein
MKTWKRFGYGIDNGTVYVGSEEDLVDCKEDHKLRIMREDDFIKMKRVYDAAMVEIEVSERLAKACEKARARKR